ncbi:MAG: ABC transporter ATP-binding protein [Chloracidobacterium sp.]|uniref:ABC transporter ATP-binding protein n=1 Tax=Chloracidobacterium validum TaxID=2821543 RepID=A0ABX8BAD1_9BACT|nr:ABC transporter ATP-binding protein [Chloracidobacterium validum]QUW03377.1 ABC transporter ATP-binding protein [Chloracidobacterium validum]
MSEPHPLSVALPLLTVENVCVAYGAIEAVHDISLTVNPGEVVTLIGANGAGKTTLLKTIMGLLKPTRGRVVFNGEDLTGYPTHAIVARGLALSPEGRGIFPDLTVLENLELGAYRQPDRAQFRRDLEHVRTLFPRVNERLHQRAGTLSGGEQQMVAIGRALMSRPKLLLLDEPSLGLAPMVTQSIFDALGELNREGLTILLVEQNAHLALARSHRGYVLETGRIWLAGNAAELARDARVQEAYLGQ